MLGSEFNYSFLSLYEHPHTRHSGGVKIRRFWPKASKNKAAGLASRPLAKVFCEQELYWTIGFPRRSASQELESWSLAVAAGPRCFENYFFSLSPSFLGWHFSQTLPLSAAFTQHLCSHFLPASVVASQQAASRLLEQKARARLARTNALIDFILFTFLGRLFILPTVFVGTCAVFRRLSLDMTGFNVGDFSDILGNDNNQLVPHSWTPLHPGDAIAWHCVFGSFSACRYSKSP